MSEVELSPRARGWLKYLWRKATTPDDWSESGEPHPWWDRYSTPPMTNFPRFDLSESSYALAMMADVTPAWREVYTRILDDLVARHTTFWAAVDWLSQFGHDPKRAQYPEAWKGTLVPAHLWGNYDAPGWTANGVDPWGLQKDPIGADGNLFFRGFFNLVLSTYAYVSGDDKWNKPFQVAGVESSRHEWSHPCIAEFLATQWAKRPEGPHCENTKIWPYCLSAAGLGLKLFDRIHGTDHHQVWEPWTEHAKKHYMVLSDDGRLESMALYYDPIVGHAHMAGPAGGLAPSFYILPQDRALAERLYRAGIEALGWRDRDRDIQVGDPRMPSLVLTLARELGDTEVENRLRELAEQRFEPRSFGDEGSEFGYWFGLGEDYPRGQLSGLMICADVGEPGAWSRVFEQPQLAKFDQPTVTGVDFPRLGIAAARNDLERAVLEVRSYAAEPAARGAETRFRVVKLADPAAVEVRLGGDLYPRWRALGEESIEIETTVDDHAFEITTGVRGLVASGAAAVRGRSSQRARGGGALARSGAPSAATIQAANRMVKSGGLCPCCS